VARYTLGWVDVAIDQYLALPASDQRLVGARVLQLVEDPEAGASYDARTDLWTTTDEAGVGLISYTFGVDRPRLVILRLVYESPRVAAE
jgi:hypothetical protein